MRKLSTANFLKRDRNKDSIRQSNEAQYKSTVMKCLNRMYNNFLGKLFTRLKNVTVTANRNENKSKIIIQFVQRIKTLLVTDGFSNAFNLFPNIKLY